MAYSTQPETCWIHSSHGNVPKGAVQAGYDTCSKCAIYVCRAHCDGQLVPGKVAPSHHCAYIGIHGKEIKVTEYEVLTDPNDQLTWHTSGGDGGIPVGAKAGGYDTNRMTLFIARGKVSSGDLCCGKYVPQCRMCYLPYNMKENSPASFEILVEK